MLHQTFVPADSLSISLEGIPGIVALGCTLESAMQVVAVGDEAVLAKLQVQFVQDELKVYLTEELDENYEHIEEFTITVLIPVAFLANVSVNRVKALLSQAHLKEVQVTASGLESCILQGDVQILSGQLSDRAYVLASSVEGSADMKLSDSSGLRLPVFCGDLSINASGEATFEGRGRFTQISATLDGSARITTKGAVTGNLTVDDRTFDGFRHSGAVFGETKVSTLYGQIC